MATQLAAAGWKVEPTGTVHVLGELALGAQTLEASVLAVVHAVPAARRPWPGWAPEALEAGYVGCLRTSGWTVYCRNDLVEDFGSQLSTVPDDLVEGAAAELAEQLVFWRNSALAHWSGSALASGDRSSAEVLKELADLRAELEATHRTLSWRVTKPLRALRGSGLRKPS